MYGYRFCDYRPPSYWLVCFDGHLNRRKFFKQNILLGTIGRCFNKNKTENVVYR